MTSYINRFWLSVLRSSILCLVMVFFFGGVKAYGQTTLFNGEQVPGVVIQHSPASTGVFLGSPSLVILPGGEYIASFEYFGASGSRTDVYRSTDEGQSWSMVSAMFNQIWSNLFVHDNDLYSIGTRVAHGDLIIRKSTDGGVSWTYPSDASTGLLKESTSVGYHTAPVPVVVANGRIWRAYEDIGGGGSWPNYFRAGVMSAPLDSDLLDADSWEYTNLLARDPQWLGAVGTFNGWLEGNAVVDRNGQVVNVLRVDVGAGQPEFTAIARVEDNTTLTFNPDSDLVPMSGGAKKFTIRYNELTDSYWTLANIVNQDNYDPDVLPGAIRNTIAVMVSTDLTDWSVKEIVLQDLTDPENIAFQYLDWQFDGTDIVAVSRTSYPDGLGGADDYHNSNFITFHRFEDVLPEPSIPGDVNGDGFVGLDDLDIILNNWNTGIAPGSGSPSIPEPSGFVLAVLSSGALVGRHSNRR